MTIQFSYKKISQKSKFFLENYVKEKKGRIQTLISESDYKDARLEVRSEKFAKKEAFKVELFLSFSNHNFISSEDDHTIIEAFDLALDKLIIQLRRYHEKIKN